MRTRIILSAIFVVLVTGFLVFQPMKQPEQNVSARPLAIYVSPLSGGCYIAAASDCRIHLEPHPINLSPGTQLKSMQISLYNVTDGRTTVVYDFKTDVSNPPLGTDSVYTPSLVAQDFAAVCGKSYQIYLLGQDSGDPNPYVLGATDFVTCPASMP
jgi:hypothetical protein